MPQLDYTLIFNQVFWLFFVFTLLYIVICYYFLPLLFKIFKTRNQIFRKLITEAKNVNKDLKTQTLFYKNNIKNFSRILNFIQSATYFLKNYEVVTLKKQLVPLAIVSFVSSKVLFNQICKNLR